MTSLQLYYINILFFLSFLYNREYKIINIKMQYSTIQEAYNIDCLKPPKKSSKSSSQNSNNANNINPNNTYNSSQPYNIENNSVASNKESVNYNNASGGSCSPIQAPTYNIPGTEEAAIGSETKILDTIGELLQILTLKKSNIGKG